MSHLTLHALPINTQGTVSIVGHWYAGVAELYIRKALASHKSSSIPTLKAPIQKGIDKLIKK